MCAVALITTCAAPSTLCIVAAFNEYYLCYPRHALWHTVDHLEPTLEDIKAAVAFIKEHYDKKEGVYIHCKGMIHRTPVAGARGRLCNALFLCPIYGRWRWTKRSGCVVLAAIPKGLGFEDGSSVFEQVYRHY